MIPEYCEINDSVRRVGGWSCTSTDQQLCFGTNDLAICWPFLTDPTLLTRLQIPTILQIPLYYFTLTQPGVCPARRPTGWVTSPPFSPFFLKFLEDPSFLGSILLPGSHVLQSPPGSHPDDPLYYIFSVSPSMTSSSAFNYNHLSTILTKKGV